MAWRIYGDDGATNGPVFPVSPADPPYTVESLVLSSLLCDARDDTKTEPRGFWADAYETNGDRWGSRLWTIPQIVTDETVKLTADYAAEALAWMKDDGLCSSAPSAVATRDEGNRIRLEIQIDGCTVAVLGGP